MKESQPKRNDRITDLEAALQILSEVRLKTYHSHNDVAHHVLCQAERHLHDELRAMIADPEGGAQ